MKKLLAFFLFTLCFANSFSQGLNQPDFVKDLFIPVIENGVVLKNPWAGGLSVPQFYPIDLNNDGILDLLVYEKGSKRSYTYLNNGTANTIDYVYTPKYEKIFDLIYNFVILKDYNNDGKIDLYTADYFGSGMTVYKNISSTNQDVKFEQKIDLVRYLSFNGKTNIPVNQYEYPTILDLDKDGDLDILMFSNGPDTIGDWIIFYKNQSVELYNNVDSLTDFTVGKYCWGLFRESRSDCVAKLNKCPNLIGNEDSIYLTNYINQKQNSGLHAGSAILAFNANGDSAIDLLVGDVGCNTMYVLINGGTNVQANMTSVIYNWPTAHPINIPVFPAAFSLDVNNDNVNDLIIAPNITNASENFKSVWLYLNTGTESAPNFTFITDQFLSKQMLDFGEGCYPTLIDYNNDGLNDILAGNYGYFEQSGNFKSGLAFLKNIGTSSNPSFQLENRNYADINSLDINGISPTIGDLDGDNDLDMLLGESAGTLVMLKNQAGPLNTPNFVFNSAIYQGIDVTSFISPLLLDFDLDGKLDLLAGFQGFLGGNSFLKYYKNIGTNTSPQFVLQKDTLGNILINQQYIPKGYTSVAIADMNGDLTRELLMADNSGLIRVYAINESNLSGTFQYLYTINPEMGRRINIAVGDINNDGQQDLIIGSYAGGLCILRQDNTSGIVNEFLELPILVYPNPANDFITIQLKAENIYLSTQVQLTDLLGREIFNSLYSNSDILQIPVSEINNGVYLVTVKSGNKQSTKKIVIRR